MTHLRSALSLWFSVLICFSCASDEHQAKSDTKSDSAACLQCANAFSTCIDDARGAHSDDEDARLIAETGCSMNFNDCEAGTGSDCRRPGIGCSACESTFSSCISDAGVAHPDDQDDRLIAETGCSMDFNDCEADTGGECLLPGTGCVVCEGAFSTCISDAGAAHSDDKDARIIAETGCSMDFNECEEDQGGDCQIPGTGCPACESTFSSCITAAREIHANDVDARIIAETGCSMDFNDCEADAFDDCQRPILD